MREPDSPPSPGERLSIFQEPPDDLNSDWRHGVLLVGLGEYQCMGLIEAARAYRGAALALVERALSGGVEWAEAHPALFLCRHTLELYLKAVLPDWEAHRANGNKHDIVSLAARLAEVLNDQYRMDEIERLCAFIDEFGKIDPKAMVFRFPDGAQQTFKRGIPKPDYEIWIDFRHLLETMVLIFDALERVWLNSTGTQRGRT